MQSEILSSFTSAEDETPHGNGVMFRACKGFQVQMCGKPDLDHFMISMRLTNLNYD